MKLDTIQTSKKHLSMDFIGASGNSLIGLIDGVIFNFPGKYFSHLVEALEEIKREMYLKSLKEVPPMKLKRLLEEKTGRYFGVCYDSEKTMISYSKSQL